MGEATPPGLKVKAPECKDFLLSKRHFKMVFKTVNPHINIQVLTGDIWEQIQPENIHVQNVCEIAQLKAAASIRTFLDINKA